MIAALKGGERSQIPIRVETIQNAEDLFSLPVMDEVDGTLPFQLRMARMEPEPPPDFSVFE